MEPPTRCACASRQGRFRSAAWRSRHCSSALVQPQGSDLRIAASDGRCASALAKPQGSDMMLAASDGKGRIALCETPVPANGIVLREEPVPLAMYTPMHCFRCAGCIVVDAPQRADGFVAARPGVVKCMKCQRYFCSRRCTDSAQHRCECTIMQIISAGLVDNADPWLTNTAAEDQAAALYARMHAEAVARLRLYRHHEAATNKHLAFLSSSYPDAPFGEYQRVLTQVFGRLARALGDEVHELWHTYGVIKTNHDVLNAPAPAPGQPKPPPICMLLRPRISLLAHACRPTCYIEIDFNQPAGGVARLCVWSRAFDPATPGPSCSLVVPDLLSACAFLPTPTLLLQTHAIEPRSCRRIATLLSASS